MIERVVLAYDGSPESNRAFEVSLEIAAAARVQIVAIHVIEPLPPPLAMADPIGGLDPTPILAEAAAEDAAARAKERERFARLLDQLLQTAQARGVTLRPIIEDGILVDRLAAHAGPADLIAAGLKGRFARAGVGSSTKRLVTHAPCPVLVTNAEAPAGRDLVAAFDGRPPAQRAAAWARDAAQQCGARLALVAPAGNAEAVDAARAACVGAEVIEAAASSDRALIEAAGAKANERTATLVVGAYAESWLRQLLTGGVAAEAVAIARGPIVLVH